MTRKLVAALACRAGGKRLYAKPLQNLDAQAGVTILDQIIANLKSYPAITDIVLGISEGRENLAFADVAKRWGVRHIWGDPVDVLGRLIQCGRAAQATDVFRMTTECPFPETRVLDEAWARHLEHGNDVTSTDGLPEGTHFEIYRLDTLETAHAKGGQDERSELCSLYIRRHLSDFRIEVVDVPEAWKRQDLRLTVDYPEDLIVCRAVYAAFREEAPRIPLDRIIAWLDTRPDLKALVAPYVAPKSVWTPAAAPAPMAGSHR